MGQREYSTVRKVESPAETQLASGLRGGSSRSWAEGSAGRGVMGVLDPQKMVLPILFTRCERPVRPCPYMEYQNRETDKLFVGEKS